jgi:four helix bundle protein
MSVEVKTNSYKDLIVWQKSILLVKKIYKLTLLFPTEEKFGLISQMRRAAVSIPSNIAEGQARHRTGEFIQFVSVAEGSLAELDTQITISVELDYCKEEDLKEIFQLVTEIRKMLNALRLSLQARR